MELPYDREDLEQLSGGLRGLTPIPPAEGDLGDLLPRAETIVHSATPKTLPPEISMDPATEIRAQIGTGLPGFFVDREIDRSREGRRDTAQPETALAISSEAAATAVRAKFKRSRVLQSMRSLRAG